MTLKPGVKFFTTQASTGNQWSWENLVDTFEGQSTIAVQQHSYSSIYPNGKLQSRAEYRYTASGLASLGEKRYRDEDSADKPSGKEVWTPVWSTPASLKPGESFTIDSTSYLTWFNVTAAPNTTAYPYNVTFTFLGIEDVTLGTGQIVKNACKLRGVTNTSKISSEVGQTNVFWVAAGWGEIKEEWYDKSGTLKDTDYISKVLVAP